MDDFVSCMDVFKSQTFENALAIILNLQFFAVMLKQMSYMVFSRSSSHLDHVPQLSKASLLCSESNQDTLVIAI